MLSFGYRVQKSVLEGFSSKDFLGEIKKRLREIIDPHEDSVRIYPLCAECSQKVEILGAGKLIEDVNYIII